MFSPSPFVFREYLATVNELAGHEQSQACSMALLTLLTVVKLEEVWTLVFVQALC